MNWEKSEFKKIIAITKEDFDFIDKIKKKKSKAGKLKEIIEFYKNSKSPLWALMDKLHSHDLYCSITT